MEIFKRGEDVHTATASRVFGVTAEEIDPGMRSKAKMINYGIVYGLSDYGLADRLNIPREEAKEFIDAYLDRFPQRRRVHGGDDRAGQGGGLRQDAVGAAPADPASCGPATTRCARSASASRSTRSSRAPPPTSSSSRWCAPMRRSRSRALQTKLLLTIHDELLFEGPPEEADERGASWSSARWSPSGSRTSRRSRSTSAPGRTGSRRSDPQPRDLPRRGRRRARRHAGADQLAPWQDGGRRAGRDVLVPRRHGRAGGDQLRPARRAQLARRHRQGAVVGARRRPARRRLRVRRPGSRENARRERAHGRRDHGPAHDVGRDRPPRAARRGEDARSASSACSGSCCSSRAWRWSCASRVARPLTALPRPGARGRAPFCQAKTAGKPSRQLRCAGVHASSRLARSFAAPCARVMTATPYSPAARRARNAGTRIGRGAPAARASAGSHSAAGAGSSSTTL